MLSSIGQFSVGDRCLVVDTEERGMIVYMGIKHHVVYADILVEETITIKGGKTIWCYLEGLQFLSHAEPRIERVVLVDEPAVLVEPVKRQSRVIAYFCLPCRCGAGLALDHSQACPRYKAIKKAERMGLLDNQIKAVQRLNQLKSSRLTEKVSI